jgi:DNA-directed RNA polymerase subunit RPC12/RpoP
MKRHIDCPYCKDSIAVLDEYDNDIWINKISKKINVKMLTYVCNTCWNSFTTTESDTIVSDRISKKIRNEQRKDKIKKYVP